MGKKILSVAGGCSVKKRAVGYQFVEGLNSHYYLEGSFGMMGGGSDTSSSSSYSGDFLIGQSFKVKGCKACGNKFVYQCGNCGSFVCYDGKAAVGAVCPVCGNNSNVPATTDERIVRSSVAKKIQIVMAMDVSTSMNEKTAGGRTRMDDTKESAIKNFVRQFPDAEIALVTFGTSVTTVCDFTLNHTRLIDCINRLRASGGTASPFRHICNEFPRFVSGADGTARYIVVLTDGAWAGNGDGHINTAKSLRRDGVNIITIGCAGADMYFLSQVASQGANIEVSGDDIGSAYATAAQKIAQ